MTGHRTTTDWDARSYDKLAAPQERWGRTVLERLPLEGAETVLDAGSGSGRVTKLLLEKLPRGRVIGIDGSPSMVEMAREAFEGDDRVTLVNSDLLALNPELLREVAGIDSVDVVFSNATFHWIADHDQLFQRLFAVLRPGGRLVAQCGGRGNVSEWVAAIMRVARREPFAEHVGGFVPWNFYGPDETKTRLAVAGFEEIACSLEEQLAEPGDARQFVGVVGLASHHERLPEELREPFTDAVMKELPDPLELRYVRLNLSGVRPPQRVPHG